MPILYFVRHAKPSAGWGEDPDPGLDELGVTQAQKTAAALASQTSPIKILTSPLRRCRETAATLALAWGATADVFDAVAEIPAPPLSLTERHQWLMTAMSGTWRQMQDSAPPSSPDFLAWRSHMLSAVMSIREPAVVFSHFVAINVLVGAARNSDNVVCFRPDYASITIVDTDRGTPRIVELGREAVTNVLTRK